ncbi:MAG: flagellar hook-associated protein FlgK [Campylobacterales bacterium]
MSLMSTLYTGYSGLQVSQLATDIIGNNIANAENPKYTRQRVDISARFSLPLHPGDVGTGAQADQVIRIHDEFVYSRFRSASTGLEYQEFAEKILVEVSKYFPDVNEVGIQRDLIDFFDSWQKLSANPSEDSQKIVLAESAKNLGRGIQDVRTKLTDMQNMIDGLLTSAVDEVNRLAKRIADISKEIKLVEATKYDHANKLRDERDNLELQLQKLTGAQVIKSGLKTMTETDPNVADFEESYSILLGGYAIVDNGSYHPITALAAENASGAQKAIFFQHRDLTLTNISVQITGGKIGSILDLRGRSFNPDTGEPADGTLQKFKDMLDVFSRGIIQSVNDIYAGSATDSMKSDIIGDTVGLTARQSKGTYISELGDLLRNEVQAGKMTIATYALDGTRLMPDISVQIDPKTMTLQGVADAINAEMAARNLDGEATVEGGAFSLRTGGRGTGTKLGTVLIADDHSLVRSALDMTGYKRLSVVDAVDIPFEITNGSFKVGVYDTNGTLKAEREIVIDKDSNDPLYSTLAGIAAQINMPYVDDNLDNDMINDVDNLLTASFSGNRFQIDTRDKNAGLFFNITDNGTGFAGAVGLHKFLQGSGARDIDLFESFRNDATLINAYDVPVVGNNNIANAMQQLQYNQVSFFNQNGTVHTDTLMGRYKYVAGTVAEDTASTQMALATARALHETVQTQQNSISQVNIDEEMTNLIRFQSGYAANARLISTIQIMLDTLLGIKQ